MSGPVVRPLEALPKAHLHIHLEGAMRASTLAEMAAHYDRPVPEIRGFGSFTAFVEMYHAALDVIRTYDDLQRITREVIEDNAAAGAVWVEAAFCPTNHRDRLGGDEDTLNAVIEAGSQVADRFGVGFGVMVTADRTRPPEMAAELAELAAKYAGRGVVSFGLANDEIVGPGRDFVEAFRIANDAGLLSTPHAGELVGPESVVDALDLLRADRLEHGVRSIEDPEVLARVADSGVCLDVCPSSNLLLSVVPSLDDHPLPRLLDAGVRCSINADDPLLFGPNLGEEYELCRDRLNLSDQQLAACARSSIEASGAPRREVGEWVAGIDRWLSNAPSS